MRLGWRYLFAVVLMFGADHAQAQELDAISVVKRCYYNEQGADQRTRLQISIRNAEGREASSEYVRWWKQYGPENEIEEKMVLFTLEPKETRGVNYMRWSYRSGIPKPPEQWVYLPELKKVRRVSQRDPNDMTWGLTDEDFRIRLLDEDDHTLVDIREEGGSTVYLVESRPKSPSVYGRWVTEFVRPGNWESCNRFRVEYFDKQDAKLKEVTYTWQTIDGAWIWDTVTIRNEKNLSVVVYRNVDTEVNVGLTDDDFTERRLRRGP